MTDHIKGAAGLAKLGVDIYTSQGTIDTLGQLSHPHRFHAVSAHKQLTIGTFTVMPFDLQHDAAEPLGFLLYSTATREKLLYLTDTYYCKYTFSGLTHIMVECNYGADELRQAVADNRTHAARAPRLLKSHMSIDTLLDFLRANDLSLTQQIYLLHISDDNSDAERFKREVQKLTGAEVYVC